MGRMMSAETDSCADVRHVLRQGPWRALKVWRENKKDSTDEGWTRLAGRSSCATPVGLASSLIFALLREAEPKTFHGIPFGPGPSCWLVLRLGCLC